VVLSARRPFEPASPVLSMNRTAARFRALLWAASANESIRPTSAQHTHCGGKTTVTISVIFQHLGECDDGREPAAYCTVPSDDIALVRSTIIFSRYA
jgi:hypothetical protein